MFYQLSYLALMLAVSLFCEYLCLVVPGRSHSTVNCRIARDHTQVYDTTWEVLFYWNYCHYTGVIIAQTLVKSMSTYVNKVHKIYETRMKKLLAHDMNL